MDSRSMKSLDLVEKRTANPRPSSLFPVHSQARYIEYESVRRFAATNTLIHQPKFVQCRHVAVDACSYKLNQEIAVIHGRKGHLFCSRYCSLDPYQKKSESVRIKGNRTAFVETLAADGRFKHFQVKRKKSSPQNRPRRPRWGVAV
jgi:hypothetical protein